MKTQDYKAILRALEQAIEICDRASGFMDEAQCEICAELRATHGRLVHLVRTVDDETT